MGTVISISPAKKRIQPTVDALAEKAWELRLTLPDETLKLSWEVLETAEDTGYEKGKALALRNISFINWKNSLFDQSTNNVAEALSIFKKLNDKTGIADCFWISGLNLTKKKEFSHALNAFLKAYELYTEQGNIYGRCLILNNIGEVYFQMGFDEKALSCFNDSYKNLEKKDECLPAKAEILSNIALVYANINNFKKALAYFTDSYKISRKLKDAKKQADTLYHLGNIKWKEGINAEALKFHYQCLKLKNKLKDIHGLADSYYNIGLIKLYTELYNEATKWFSKALAAYEKAGDKKSNGYTELQLAIAKIKTGKLKQAEKSLTATLTSANQLDDKDLALHVHEVYAEYYESLHNAEKTLYHLRQSLVLNKEIKQAEMLQYLKDIETIILAEKNRREIDENKLLSKHLNDKDFAVNQVMQVKKDILRYASHDLKSPLNSIKGLASLMPHSINNTRQINEYISLIEEAADQMLNLVNDIQHASLIESGFTGHKPVLFDLTALAKMCANSFLVQTHKKNQTIELKATKQYFAYGDKEKLTNVLTNLVSNASKFSFLNQRITIKLSTVKEFTRCEVKDNGQGLTSADLKDVFQQFKKLSAKPTNSEESVGLGLYICKQLVEANKGRIWAESQGKNKGSRFIFELPNHAPVSDN